VIAVNKKAVSPLVATILLIAFAIALGAVVMNWGRGYIEEKAEFVQGGAAVEPADCHSIAFSILDVGGSPQICTEDGEIRALIQNEGPAIENLKATVITSSGVINRENLLASVLKTADTTNIKIPYDPSGEIIQVKIIPQINIDGDYEFCTAEGITVESVSNC
jgi:flagellin-like protein